MRKTGLLAAASGLGFSTKAAFGPGLTANERRHGRLLRDGEGHGDAVLTPAQIAELIKKSMGDKIDEIKGIAEDALGKAAAGEPLSQTAKEDADKALTGLSELKGIVSEIEQKLNKVGNDQDNGTKTLGDLFIESEGIKQLLADGSAFRGRASMEAKATLTLATTDTAGAVGDGAQNARLPGILALPQRRLTVRDLITPGRMDGNTLEYVKETGFTNNAAPVAEAAAKPQSDLKLDLVTTSAKVIAHYMKASRQAMDDVAQLRSLVDNRLLYGLAYVEETQLLTGDGTGQNLNGIITQATAYSAPFDPAGTETNLDMIRLAALQAYLAEYPATGVVMHPSDWARIELLKDSTGRYIIGNPQGNINATVWGLPVVQTQAITIDKFLVGAFRLGAQLFDRWSARVEVATENEDDFIKNLITVLAEERLALAVYRPQAFIYGDFGNVA